MRLALATALFATAATAHAEPLAVHNGRLNVGTSILRNYLITTDFKQRAVWLESVGTVN